MKREQRINKPSRMLKCLVFHILVQLIWAPCWNLKVLHGDNQVCSRGYVGHATASCTGYIDVHAGLYAGGYAADCTAAVFTAAVCVCGHMSTLMSKQMSTCWLFVLLLEWPFFVLVNTYGIHFAFKNFILFNPIKNCT